MGPGPSDAAPSVPWLSRSLLVTWTRLHSNDGGNHRCRAVFRTRNPATFPVSGTGSAGMEFCMVNLAEPGDEVVICINGVFGMRMAEVAERCGARVIKVEAPGRDRPAEKVALAPDTKLKLVGLVHAETSTGALTPVEEISRLPMKPAL